MSASNKQIVPKRTGKFVTFSEECDDREKNYQDYLEAACRKKWTPTRFPQADEIINLPLTEREEIIPNEDSKPSSSQKYPRVIFKASTVKIFKRTARRVRQSVKRNKMKEICKKLERIHQLNQMDDLTALCKEKMSISTKEAEKMDEDSSD